MDAKRFAAIAISLIAETNRRRMLGDLLAGGLGALGLAKADEAAARTGKCLPECDECNTCKKGKCKKSHRGKKRCKKDTCQPKPAGTQCMAPTGGATCQNGTCTCPGGLTNCGGVCKNLKSDDANCGVCGTVCDGNHSCCNGDCVVLAADEGNCGACGHVCPAIKVCQAGACYCPNACDPDLEARVPETCTCCFVSGFPCPHPGMGFPPQPDPNCCSGFCEPFAVNSGICAQGAEGAPCNVNAHCTSNTCDDGLLCAA